MMIVSVTQGFMHSSFVRRCLKSGGWIFVCMCA